MIGILALPDLSEFLLFAVNDASNVLRVSSRVFFLFFSSIVAFSDHRQRYRVLTRFVVIGVVLRNSSPLCLVSNIHAPHIAL